MATRWEERDRHGYTDDRRPRRHMDDIERDDREHGWSDRAAGSIQRGWDRAREAVRDATDRDRDGRRGLAEWNDDDRQSGSREYRDYDARSESWQRRPGSEYREPDHWRRESAFGDTSRYAGADRADRFDRYASPGWKGPGYSTRDSSETNYVGRGPRGYQRGDERIREDICERLTEDPRVDASDIEVQVSNAEVTLSGSVRTRDEKHFTEHVVERIIGVREVNNNLKVRPPDEVLGTARSGASVLGLTETPPPEPTSKTK